MHILFAALYAAGNGHQKQLKVHNKMYSMPLKQFHKCDSVTLITALAIEAV